MLPPAVASTSIFVHTVHIWCTSVRGMHLRVSIYPGPEIEVLIEKWYLHKNLFFVSKSPNSIYVAFKGRMYIVVEKALKLV